MHRQLAALQQQLAIMSPEIARQEGISSGLAGAFANCEEKGATVADVASERKFEVRNTHHQVQKEVGTEANNKIDDKLRIPVNFANALPSSVTASLSSARTMESSLKGGFSDAIAKKALQNESVSAASADQQSLIGSIKQ